MGKGEEVDSGLAVGSQGTPEPRNNSPREAVSSIAADTALFLVDADDARRGDIRSKLGANLCLAFHRDRVRVILNSEESESGEGMRNSERLILRKAFLRATREREITPSLPLANEWFTRNQAWKLETEEALRRFKECIHNHVPLR